MEDDEKLEKILPLPPSEVEHLQEELKKLKAIKIPTLAQSLRKRAYEFLLQKHFEKLGFSDDSPEE